MNGLSYLWLSKQKAPKATKHQRAQLTKHAQPKKPRAPIVGSTGDYQADLMFMDAYARYNGGKGIILNVIHVPSRYVYSALVKTKAEAGQALLQILAERRQRFRLWAGTEFVSKHMRESIEKLGITLIVVNKSKQNETPTLSSYSMAVVERFNKTLRTLIERWITVNGRTDYQSIYDQLIETYNKSPHSSLDSMTPETVEKYLQEETGQPGLVDMLEDRYAESKDRAQTLQRTIKQWFPKGSYVRTALPEKAFSKSALPKFSDTIMKVVGHELYRVRVVPLDASPPSAANQTYSVLYHKLTRVPKPTKAEAAASAEAPVEVPTDTIRETAQALAKTTRLNKQDFGPGLGNEIESLDEMGKPVYKERLRPTEAGLTQSGRKARSTPSVYKRAGK